jgi:hypothetical protein
MYFFDRAGTLTARVNGTAMPFEEIEKVMLSDGADETEIAMAREAHAKLKATT